MHSEENYFKTWNLRCIKSNIEIFLALIILDLYQESIRWIPILNMVQKYLKKVNKSIKFTLFWKELSTLLMKVEPSNTLSCPLVRILEILIFYMIILQVTLLCNSPISYFIYIVMMRKLNPYRYFLSAERNSLRFVMNILKVNKFWIQEHMKEDADLEKYFIY